MCKAVDISKLVYKGIVVGYRFKLSNGNYVDTDSETFDWCNKMYNVSVSSQIRVYLVDGECKSKSEIESKITVEDASENSDLVSLYLSQIEDYRYNEIKSKENATLQFTQGSSSKKGYLKYHVTDADTFIKEFCNLGLSREMLILNIEKYGLEEHTKYILSCIAECERV